MFFSVFSVFSVFFSVFSVCFETVCFGVSVVSLLYRNREFQLIWNKQKTHPNRIKESIFGYFSEKLGLFRFVTKQFCFFRLFRYRFETPKQTEFFSFWFHETNAKQILFRFVSVRTKNYFCLFRGHPGWKSGKNSYVPLWDRMEGGWLWTPSW